MKTSDFDGIAAGLRHGIEIKNGTADPTTYRVHVPDQVNVAEIRRSLKLTQAAFAQRFGFSAAAVADWEQGRRQPEASARVLLTVIAREPEAVQRALRVA